MFKKGQTAGLITSLVFGIASLVIGVIIAFVIVSTLSGAGLLESSRSTGTVTDETDGFINSTTYQIAGLDTNFIPGTISIVAKNFTDGTTIPAANYTLSSTGVLTNATIVVYTNVTLDYSFSIYSAEELSGDALSANFTRGVDNVSAKIPTVLLVAAIVLILSVLAILVGVWQKMRIGGGSI